MSNTRIYNVPFYKIVLQFPEIYIYQGDKQKRLCAKSEDFEDSIILCLKTFEFYRGDKLDLYRWVVDRDFHKAEKYIFETERAALLYQMYGKHVKTKFFTLMFVYPEVLICPNRDVHAQKRRSKQICNTPSLFEKTVIHCLKAFEISEDEKSHTLVWAGENKFYKIEKYLYEICERK